MCQQDRAIDVPSKPNTISKGILQLDIGPLFSKGVELLLQLVSYIVTLTGVRMEYFK